MNPSLLWFLLGIVFLLAELATPTTVLLFFGVGAWAAAAAALLGLTTGWQLAAFMVVSLLTLIFLRRHLRAVFGGRSHKAVPENSQQAHPLSGRQGTVSKTLHPGQVGEVSIDGSFWRAVAQSESPQGRPVRVLGALPADALILRVAPLEENK